MDGMEQIQINIEQNIPAKTIHKEQIQVALDLSQKIIQLDPENLQSEAVVLLGSSGMGKSVFILYMSGAKMECKQIKEEKRNHILISDQQPTGITINLNNFQISNSMLSGTFQSAMGKHKNEKIFFYDNPGFGDNRGITQDITNGIFIKRIFDIHKRIKILFFSSESEIQLDRMETFIKRLTTIVSSFPDKALLEKCMGLIITKAREIENSSQFQNQIKQFLMTNKNLSENASYGLQLLSSDKFKDKIIIQPYINKQCQDIDIVFHSFFAESTTMIKQLESFQEPKFKLVLEKSILDMLIPFLEDLSEQQEMYMILNKHKIVRYMVSNMNFFELKEGNILEILSKINEGINKNQNFLEGIENNMNRHNKEMIRELVKLAKLLDFDQEDNIFQLLENVLIQQEYFSDILETDRGEKQFQIFRSDLKNLHEYLEQLFFIMLEGFFIQIEEQMILNLQIFFKDLEQNEKFRKWFQDSQSFSQAMQIGSKHENLSMKQYMELIRKEMNQTFKSPELEKQLLFFDQIDYFFKKFQQYFKNNDPFQDSKKQFQKQIQQQLEQFFQNFFIKEENFLKIYNIEYLTQQIKEKIVNFNDSYNYLQSCLTLDESMMEMWKILREKNKINEQNLQNFLSEQQKQNQFKK